jgi:beta-barrel assembly-enhancing protease
VQNLRCIICLFLLAIGSESALGAPGTALTDADEVRIGGLLAEKFAQSEGMQSTPQSKQIEKYLQTVGDHLAAHARRKIPYKFHFDPSPTFKSAFALPGGEVFVGAGILAFMDTEDQLAIVLAHEMEHIDLNQCRDRLIKQLETNHLTTQTASQLKIDSFLPGYGHEGEFAADKEGVELAANSGYSPEAAVRLLNTFVILGQQMNHTDSESEENLKARIAQVQQLIVNNKLSTPAEKPLGLP